MKYPVNNLDDAYNACNPDKPLEAGDLRYLDLNEVRNKQSMGVIATRIKRRTQSQDFCKQLITGHTGCGKSTELKRLQKKLEDELNFVVFIDTQSSLDLQSITYQDILLNIAQGIISALNKQAINLGTQFIQDLEQWFAEKIITADYINESKASVTAKAKAGIKVPLIAELLSSLTGEIRSGSSRRIQIRKNIQREQQVFIAHLNDLLLAARIELKKQGYIELIIIVDGLEKIKDTEVYSDLFLKHSEQLSEIQSHVLYTIPVALGFDSNLGNYFAGGAFFIPMVKYQSVAGKQHLFDLVAKRIIVADIFANEDLLYDLITMSGGSVRDLLRLICFATETDSDKIQADDVQRAINTLVIEYDLLVKQEDIPLLKQVMLEKRIVKTEDRKYERLLMSRLVHEYRNGSSWAALHPALTKIDWLQTALAENDAGE